MCDFMLARRDLVNARRKPYSLPLFSAAIPLFLYHHSSPQVLGRNDNGWDQGQLFLMQTDAYLAPHGMSQVRRNGGF
jgi:hypothetical protein